MSPIVAELAAGHGDEGHVLWWALALGADLGGNATAIGASANVVALGIAAREGHPIGFWEFTKYGLVVTAVTVIAVRALPVAAVPLSRAVGKVGPVTSHIDQRMRMAQQVNDQDPTIGRLVHDASRDISS